MIVILLAMVDEDDRPLIEQLYDRYEKQLYLLAYDIVKNHHDAQDCVQDTFKSAAQNMDRYRTRAEDSRIYLLRATCRNIAIDKYRKNARTPLHTPLPAEDEDRESADNDPYQLADPDEDMFAELVANLTAETLVGLIRSLAPKYREVIILHYYEDMSVPEIAEQLGVTPKTVYNRMNKAYDLIREKGGKELYELYYYR